MTKQDALNKIKELQSYVEALGEEFPQEGDEYWYVSSEGLVLGGKYDSEWIDDTNKKEIGNMFETKNEAEKYALRIKSMKPGWKPNKDEAYWTVNFHGQVAYYLSTWTWDNDAADHYRYYAGRVFKTEKEAQDWIDTYAKAWSLEE